MTVAYLAAAHARMNLLEQAGVAPLVDSAERLVRETLAEEAVLLLLRRYVVVPIASAGGKV